MSEVQLVLRIRQRPSGKTQGREGTGLGDEGLAARRGQKVQRGQNFNFNFGPRSAVDHAQPAYMQCIYNCRYACFNQRARVSLYCDTYAVLVDGCLIVL